MEESQSGAPRNFDFSFPPHRRTPLRSEMYLTLVRIISRCHDQSPRILTQDLKSDDGGNQLAQSCGNREPVELGSDTTEHENTLAQKDRASDKQLESSGSQDQVVSDTQMKIDEIEDIMGVEEVGDKIINESSEESGREQMILHELRHLLEGEDELDRENDANVLALPVKEDNSFDDIFALTNNEKNHIDLPQIVMEEPGDACKLQVDKECNSQKVSGSIGSSSDKNVYVEIPKLNDNSPGKNSSLKTSVLEVEHEIQLQGESELVKPAATSGMMSSMVPMIEDVEEGELSGDFSLDDMSLDLFCEDTVISGDKSKSEMQVSDGLVDKPDFHRNEKSDSKEKYSDSNSSEMGMVDSGGKVETGGSYNDKIMPKPELFVHRLPVEVMKVHGGDDCMPETERNKKEGSGVKEGFCSRESGTKTLVYYGDILEQNSCTQIKISEENTTKSKACLSAEQKNDDNLKKKTRGSRSGGSKKRKTERKRLKRAEMNRQQGVKRLKLLPEVKKPVSYCRHYLKGRCQEGEKCKFSHDVIPLTKSKPCCHFARNSCMKGDDCPFDHELAKYPCNNYTTTGSCFRGDDCMFSHQIPLKEDSPADVNASKLELKPALMPGDSSSKKQRSASGSAYQIQNANALTHSVGINSHTKSEKNVAETTLKSPGLAPKGISFISCGKPSMVESSKPKQVRPYPNIDNGVKVQIEQRASSPTVQILSETPKRNSPPVAPKGINFLSFGKPSGSMTGIVSSNRDRVGKSPLLDNQIISKPASSLPGDDNSVAVGKQKAENALRPENETLKKIQPVDAAFGTQTLSGKSFVKSDSQVMLPSRWGSASDGSSQEKQNIPNVPQNSSSAQWKMPALFTSGESSSGTSRNTPNSAQKALWSTLAFAAKYESGMKSNRATSALAPNAEPNKETGKASEILKFLSGIGSKTK